MSELNVLDITSLTCEMQHGEETSTFWLLKANVWIDLCGHEALTFFAEKQQKSVQFLLFS